MRSMVLVLLKLFLIRCLPGYYLALYIDKDDKILFMCALVVLFAVLARGAWAVNDTTRVQINNISLKNHFIPLLWDSQRTLKTRNKQNGP